MIELKPRETPIEIEPSEVDASQEQKIAPAVAFTDSAMAQIKRVLARKQRQLPGAFVRIGVKGGGCSGLSYFMEPDTVFDERDLTWIVQDNVRFVIDHKSLEFVEGMTVDYDLKNLLEGGWVYTNPHASRTCGCGTSFTPA